MTRSINPVFATVFFISLASSFLSKLCLAERVDLKINLGGDSVDGFVAEQEVLDLDESMAKMRYHGAIKGAGNDLNVFKTQRFTRGEDLVLNIPVADGVYTITLLFAETWKGAFSSGKRVFDVYMGSKPTGIVKVCPDMDPFRSGGAAGPVRRKFPGVATQGGLTIALRPIVQNPQIAGVIIDGYSYSNSLLEDLPTVLGSPGEQPDFSSLERVTAQTPADPSLVYDPALNPKFKSEFKDPNGLFPSASTLAPSTPQHHHVAPTPGSSLGFQLGGAQMSSNHAASPPSAPSAHAYGQPAVGGVGHPFGRGQAAQVPPTPNTPTSPLAAHAQPAAANPPSHGFSPLTALTVRPTAHYRRRLASFPPQEGYDSEKDISGRLEGMQSRPMQGQMESPPAGSNFKPNLEGYNSRDFEGTLQAPTTGYANSANFQVGGVDSAAPSSASHPTGLSQGMNPSMGSPATSGLRPAVPNAPGEMRISPAGAVRDPGPEQVHYVHPTSRLSTEDGSPQRVYQAQAQSEATRWEQGGGGYAGQERANSQVTNALPSTAETAGTPSSWSSQTSSSSEALGQGGPSALQDGVAGRPLDTPQNYQEDNSASTRTQPAQDDRSTMMAPGVQNDAAGTVPGGGYMGRSSSEQADHTSQMNPPMTASYSSQAEGMANGAMPYMGAERGAGMSNASPMGWNPSGSSLAGEYRSVKESSQEEAMGGNGGRPLSMNPGTGEDSSTRGADRGNMGWGGSLGGAGPTSDGGFGHDGSGVGMGGHQGEQRKLPSTVHRTIMEDPAYGKGGARFPAGQGYAGHMDRTGTGVEHGARQGSGAGTGNVGEGLMENGVGSQGRDDAARRSSMQGAGGGPGMPGVPGLPGIPSLPDLVGMVEGDGEGGAEGARVPTPGVHNGMNRLDGMCIDNSTHCSCGMAQRHGPVAEECLFVVNEHTDPMICARRACSGRMVCACAAGANLLCRRSHVRSILVSAQVHRHDMVEDPNVVFCRREQIEQGVGVLTPIM